MLASGTKQQIDIFNMKLEERLDDTSFMVDGVAGFNSAYLDDIKDDQENPGVVLDQGINCTDEDYGYIILISGGNPSVRYNTWVSIIVINIIQICRVESCNALNHKVCVVQPLIKLRI